MVILGAQAGHPVAPVFRGLGGWETKGAGGLAGWGAGVQLTLRRRHLFSLMAPRQPRNPVTMTMVPMAMTRLAADSEGKLGEKVAKLPCDTDSQMPTPRSPQPHSCRERKAC